MATFVLNLSLDGYVDHDAFAPDPALFRHWIERVRGLTGSVYGRRMYEVMRYWGEDRPRWSGDERDFAAAWRRQPPSPRGMANSNSPDGARRAAP